MPMTEKDLARMAELTGEELILRGERMLTLGRELLGMSAALEANPTTIPVTGENARDLLPEDRSVGRKGAVTEAIALNRARELGEFNTVEFAEELGVGMDAAMKWLGRLHEMQPPVLVREMGKFRCLLKPPLKIWVVRKADTPWTFDEAQEATGLTEGDLSAEIQKLEGEGVIDGGVVQGLWSYVPPEGGTPARPDHTPPERYPPSYADAPERGMPVRTKKSTRRQRSTSGSAMAAKNNERNWQKLEDARDARAEEQRQREQQRAQNGGSSKRSPRYRGKGK